MSSKPCDISCPMTEPMAPKFCAEGYAGEKKGFCIMPAGTYRALPALSYLL